MGNINLSGEDEKWPLDTIFLLDLCGAKKYCVGCDLWSPGGPCLLQTCQGLNRAETAQSDSRHPQLDYLEAAFSFGAI